MSTFQLHPFDQDVTRAQCAALRQLRGYHLADRLYDEGQADVLREIAAAAWPAFGTARDLVEARSALDAAIAQGDREAMLTSTERWATLLSAYAEARTRVQQMGEAAIPGSGAGNLRSDLAGVEMPPEALAQVLTLLERHGVLESVPTRTPRPSEEAA